VGSVSDDAAAGRRLEVLLAEFKALRDEINQRATYCHTIININVIASGTVASFALGGDDRLNLLLILPILGPVLGLLWLDHSWAIRGMGDYIAGLAVRVNVEAAGDGTLLGWETPSGCCSPASRRWRCCASSRSRTPSASGWPGWWARRSP
jgi:hypothetical protein